MTLVQPTVEMQVMIRSELNENVSTRDQDIEHIKEWYKKQPHLPPFDNDAIFLTFLRGCKFSLEKTKTKLDNFFTMRTACPEFFADRDPRREEIKCVMDNVFCSPMPKLTPNGRRVVVMRNKNPNTLLHSVPEGMKTSMMIGDIRLMEENVGIAGDIYILDANIMSGPQFAQNFAKFTPTLVRKFLICVQEAYPVKLKEVHIINVSAFVDTILNFVKPFLKDKIRNRIHFHTSLDSLYKFVPKDVLPEEYGGEAGPLETVNAAWMEKLLSYRDWFLEQEKLKADESKRPGKPKTYDDLFGMEGSFKKLAID